MSGKTTYSVGHVYRSKQQAWENAKRLEREKKIPMSVMRVEERGAEQHLVHNIIDCGKGATYDHYVGENERWAKACAEALTRITSQPHMAQLVSKRFLFADVWRVFGTEKVPTKFSKTTLSGINCGSLEKCCGVQGNMTCR